MTGISLRRLVWKPAEGQKEAAVLDQRISGGGKDGSVPPEANIPTKEFCTFLGFSPNML